MRGGFDFGDILLDVGKDVLKNAYKEGKEFIKSDEFKKLFNKPMTGGEDGQMTEAEWACREGYGDCRDAGVLYPMPEWRGGDTFRSDLEKIMGGAKPTNMKLYKKAKSIVNKQYSAPSAYRSGAYVKTYKDMGGTYEDDGEEKTLRRWFKEDWKDVGNKSYPVYRPTKRITKDTPLTPEEIRPDNLRQQVQTKQIIKGTKNLPPFKAKGSGIMANSQFYRTDPKRGGALKEDIQQAGSATTNETVKEIQETPMGNEDISKYFPDAQYIKYSELKNYQSITDLLPKNGSFFFLLYEHKPNVGHWVLLTRYDNKIENFDSYGLEPSKPLSWNRQETNQQLGQDKPYLSVLLRDSELPVIVNRTQFQGKTNHSSTCGAWDVLRQLSIKDGNSSLPEFTSKINEYKKKFGLTGDEIVSNLISKR
jgi:hypothetical protein